MHPSSEVRIVLLFFLVSIAAVAPSMVSGAEKAPFDPIALEPRGVVPEVSYPVSLMYQGAEEGSAQSAIAEELTLQLEQSYEFVYDRRRWEVPVFGLATNVTGQAPYPVFFASDTPDGKCGMKVGDLHRTGEVRLSTSPNKKIYYRPVAGEFYELVTNPYESKLPKDSRCWKRYGVLSKTLSDGDGARVHLRWDRSGEGPVHCTLLRSSWYLGDAVPIVDEAGKPLEGARFEIRTQTNLAAAQPCLALLYRGKEYVFSLLTNAKAWPFPDTNGRVVIYDLAAVAGEVVEMAAPQGTFGFRVAALGQELEIHCVGQQRRVPSFADCRDLSH